MQTNPPDDFEEKRPEEEPIYQPEGPVGVYPVPETRPEETAGAGEEWTPETTTSPEATYSAPEPGSGEAPPPADPWSQQSPPPPPPPGATQGDPYGGAQQQAPYHQAPYLQAQKKDKSLTMILEVLPALFGIMGIGWIYAGNTSAGIGWLIGFLVWNGIALVLDVITLGIFVCVHLPVNIGLIALSAILLNNYTKQNPHLFN
jgi:TM2 domain-containing membrane protein YozV